MTEYLKGSAYVVDGMATVREVKSLKSTYSEFAMRLLNMFFQIEVDQKELMLFFTFMKTIQ